MLNADDLFTICSVGVHVLIVYAGPSIMYRFHRGYYWINHVMGVGIIEIEVRVCQKYTKYIHIWYNFPYMRMRLI